LLPEHVEALALQAEIEVRNDSTSVFAREARGG